MSVSFVEPNLKKLREEHSANTNNAYSESVFESEEDPTVTLEKDPVQDTSLLLPFSNPELSVNHATLSNTNSNSMLFRQASSASLGSTRSDDTESYSTRTKPNGRKLSVASTLSSQTDASQTLSSVTQSLWTDSRFQKRISFDTISQAPMSHPPTSSSFRFSRPSFSSNGSGALLNRSNLEEAHSSFSVSSRHECHRTTYWSRSFLCSMSSVNNSKRALKWLVENVMENGDELVCLKVTHEESDDPSHYQNDAESLLAEVVKTVDPDLEIKIVVEVALGSIKTVVKKTMLLYQPSLVVVGTTAKTYSNVMRYMTRKTLSNYLLNHSPVPVIVILPDTIDKSRKGSAITSVMSSDKESAPVSSAASMADSSETQVTDGEPFNYLTNLVNRPALESESEFEFRPKFNYTSLFQDTSSAQDEIDPMDSSALPPHQVSNSGVASPEIQVVDIDDDGLSSFKSRSSSVVSMNFGNSRPKPSQAKRPSWSAKFLPKGLRRLT